MRSREFSFNAEERTAEKTASSVAIQHLMSSALWRAGTRKSRLVGILQGGLYVTKQLCAGLLRGFRCKLYIPTIIIDFTVFF
jgi:hypothetical protein